MIRLLRDIDSGEVVVQSLFIAGKVQGSEPGACRPLFSVSASDLCDALGTIEMAKLAYVRAVYGED